jgi:ABC-2 type transport system ATP-binding protein
MTSTHFNNHSSYVIETEGLTKAFGERTAVDGVDLAVRRGQAFGFLGPNGAGKTTLIRMLVGLTEPSSGSMRLLGRPVPLERADALARVGAIVEEPRFHPHLTGRQNLYIVAACRDREAHRRIPGALERVGLTDRADDRVSNYSMGMRQRLGIARCLLADPELLILDEPTNGLDPAGILEIRSLLRELVDEGRTVFLSSHLLDEVEKVCDSVAIVDNGTIVTAGPVGEIAAGGRRLIEVGTSEPGRAARVLSEPRLADSVEVTRDGVRLVLAPAAELEPAAAEAARRLVGAGLDLHRLEIVRATLEERFLEITTRLGEAA